MPVDDRAAIRRELEALYAAPFQRQLAAWLEAGDKLTLDDLATFARKSPDRFAQGLTLLARLAGYRQELQLTLPTLDVAQLSDAELIAEILTRRAQALLPAVVPGVGRGIEGEGDTITRLNSAVPPPSEGSLRS